MVGLTVKQKLKFFYLHRRSKKSFKPIFIVIFDNILHSPQNNPPHTEKIANTLPEYLCGTTVWPVIDWQSFHIFYSA